MLIRPGEMRGMLEKAKKGGLSIRRRLALYWICMAMAVLAGTLLLLSITGVASRTSQQFGETLENQQKNAAALLTAQMDALTAKGIAFSQQISEELSVFLAERGIAFESLNDDSALLSELESALLPALHSVLDSAPCSGAYFCLDATANTSLPEASHFRMGIYLRYSGLRSANPSGNVTYFRGTVATARENGIHLHNRWNPELDTDLIPGYRQVMAWSGDRLSEGCLWTERMPLPDTWEDIMLLCVPVLDQSGAVRGICGIELSGLYFSLSHDTVSSPYGSFVTLIAPLDGDTLLLDKALLGSTEGTMLTAAGAMTVESGKHYDTFTHGGHTYLGKYQIIPGRLADGYPLAAVTLVPEGGFQRFARTARMYWVLGSLLFLAAMLTLASVLSRRFARPITESLAAVKEGSGEHIYRSGISEIDELLAFLQSHPPAGDAAGENLPPEIEELIEGLAARAATLTGTEQAVLKHYIDGHSPQDIPELMFISASTVKAHNRNIYRKLNVDSYDALKAYIDVLTRCGRIDLLLSSTH